MDIKPVAWFRKWALDGIDVMKIQKKDRPGSWKFNDVTKHRCARDDVALYPQSAIDALTAEVERLSRANSSVRFELDMLEQVRLRDNEYLIARAEAAEAEAARLRQELAVIKGEG